MLQYHSRNVNLMSNIAFVIYKTTAKCSLAVECSLISEHIHILQRQCNIPLYILLTAEE